MDVLADNSIKASRRWSMLGLGVFAQISSAMFTNGAVFLIPALQDRGFGLSRAGLIVAMPSVGLMLTLIGWGVLVDRIGERLVLVIGPALLCAAAVVSALVADRPIALVADRPIALGAALLIGGVGAASTNGASGRVIVGWFPRHQRGLAMGIRQTAQPLGVALGALIIPMMAHTHDIGTALLIPAALAGAAAIGCAVGIIDPPRPTAAESTDLLENPYRRDSTLWRIHGVSVLLVIPQMTVWTFALVWLTDAHGWSLAAAGLAVTATQVLGAVGRIGSGVWSDRVGSRLRPLRTVAIAAAATMAALSLTDYLGWWLAIPLLVVASVITVADNGLAFTAVAEIAGPYWSGRGLGIQNTGQNLTSSAIPPVFGALISASGYPACFLTAAAVALLAIPLVPKDHPHNKPKQQT